jgi:hypothetical protein
VYDALYYVDTAEFSAGYRADNGLKVIAMIGLVPVGMRSDNTLVVYIASDYIRWTADLAREWSDITSNLAIGIYSN